MDDFDVPWPEDEEELLDFIRSELKAADSEEGVDNYNRRSEAVWRTALATFRYVANEANVNMEQARFAIMSFIRHSKGIDGPFALLDSDSMLFETDDEIKQRINNWLDSWSEWVEDQARQMVEEEEHEDEEHMHHLRMRAGMEVPD
jgi:sulfur relay (sulfurtransferase) DsrC/TusE family protein